MEDRMDMTKAQAALPGVLPSKPNAGSSDSRPDLVYCLSRAELMFGSYRKDEVNNPEIYVSGVAAVLSEFARAVVDFVTDARTGVQSRVKWVPNLAEVRSACHEATQTMRNLAQAPRRPAERYYEPPPREPGCFANVFIGDDSPSYEAMKEWAAGRDVDPREWKWGDFGGRHGIWVTLTAFYSQGGTRMARTWKAPLTDSALREKYASEEREVSGRSKPSEEIAP
jgi:hypothetical protein